MIPTGAAVLMCLGCLGLGYFVAVMVAVDKLYDRAARARSRWHVNTAPGTDHRLYVSIRRDKPGVYTTPDTLRIGSVSPQDDDFQEKLAELRVKAEDRAADLNNMEEELVPA